MSFALGRISRANLAGVHPDLVRVVERAIAIGDQDFRVHGGLRTVAEQRAMVARGVSWTMNSRHLKQPDGFGHAVDLVPLIGGRLAWDWPACRRIALAMAKAAEELDVALRWGGVWDRPLADYGRSLASIEAENQAYVARRRAAGKRAAIDGPHFELAKD